MTVEGSIQGLNLKEFFLLLSSTGLAYRRCELVRVNGTEMDIRFLRGKHAKKRSGATSKAEEATRQWKRCVGIMYPHHLSRTLAGAALADQGILPEKYYEEFTKKPAVAADKK